MELRIKKVIRNTEVILFTVVFYFYVSYIPFRNKLYTSRILFTVHMPGPQEGRNIMEILALRSPESSMIAGQ